jgi:hypothetical protein
MLAEQSSTSSSGGKGGGGFTIPCPKDCSGHGKCDSMTGRCTCEKPFFSKDCGIDGSQYKAPAEMVSAIFPLSDTTQRDGLIAFRSANPKVTIIPKEKSEATVSLAGTLNKMLSAVKTPLTFVGVD